MDLAEEVSMSESASVFVHIVILTNIEKRNKIGRIMALGALPELRMDMGVAVVVLLAEAANGELVIGVGFDLTAGIIQNHVVGQKLAFLIPLTRTVYLEIEMLCITLM